MERGDIWQAGCYPPTRAICSVQESRWDDSPEVAAGVRRWGRVSILAPLYRERWRDRDDDFHGGGVGWGLIFDLGCGMLRTYLPPCPAAVGWMVGATP